MSVEALAVVLHHSKAKGTAKLVLLGIANHQGDGGAWPSRATLAKYANVSESQVKRALQTLRGMGELVVHVQQGGLPGDEDYTRPNRYDVQVSCPPWCDRTTNHRDTRRRAGRQLGLPVPAAPVDNGGRNDAPRPAGQGEGGAPATPEGGAPMRPKPSPKPSANQVPASTTDRARDDDRPPVPANPPADELAKVREKLRTDAAAVRARESGGTS